MRWIIFVMMMVICLLLVLCYALMVMAYEADERAERMYRKWKESKLYGDDYRWDAEEQDYVSNCEDCTEALTLLWIKNMVTDEEFYRIDARLKVMPQTERSE